MYCCVAEAFSEKCLGPFDPPGRYNKTRKKGHKPLARTQQQLWLMFRFGTGDTVMAGVGIADGSRAQNTYDVGI